MQHQAAPGPFDILVFSIFGGLGIAMLFFTDRVLSWQIRMLEWQIRSMKTKRNAIATRVIGLGFIAITVIFAVVH
jgi:hypothetical protein